jgi:salicylate hydroxylase
VLANAMAASPGDPVAALAAYERVRRPRASRVVLTARARGVSNHLPSRWAAFRRDVAISVRKRLNRRDLDGRGGQWLADYDATSREALTK